MTRSVYFQLEGSCQGPARLEFRPESIDGILARRNGIYLLVGGEEIPVEGTLDEVRTKVFPPLVHFTTETPTRPPFWTGAGFLVPALLGAAMLISGVLLNL